jgi:hypothetical protein
MKSSAHLHGAGARSFHLRMPAVILANAWPGRRGWASRVRVMTLMILVCAGLAPIRAEAPTGASALEAHSASAASRSAAHPPIRAEPRAALTIQKPAPAQAAARRIVVLRRGDTSVPLEALAAMLFVLLNVALLRRRRTIDSWSSC